MVLPIMMILRRNDSPRLHFEALGQLQEIAIAQRQAVTHKAYLVRAMTWAKRLLIYTMSKSKPVRLLVIW